MNRKRIICVSTLLALALSLVGRKPFDQMRVVSAAESGTTATIEKVLIPEEKYWEYEEKEDGTVSITRFNDSDVYTWEDYEQDEAQGITYKLVVPGTIGGKKVTRVGYFGGAFYGSSRTITAIQIPEGVTSIERIGDDSLISAELPSTLKTIESYTFMECDKLTSIQLPDGLEEIGDEAFYGCRSLRNIVIPSSVSYIDETAFSDCRSVIAYEVKANNKGNYFSENGILYKKWMEEVPVYGDQIDEYGEPVADYYKEVEMKTVMSYPGGKEGEYHLDANTGFSWTAFLNCKGLTAIHVNSENPDYTSVDGVVYTKDMKTLDVCPAGKEGEYTVPEGVQSLQTNSFSNSSLHAIHLPDSLEETYETEWGDEAQGFIGSYAFYQCDSLQTITLGKNTTKKILSYLESAPNLKNIRISGENATLCALDNVVYDKEVKKLLFVPVAAEGKLVLPDTVESSRSSICGTGITELVLGKNFKVTEEIWVDDDDGDQEEYLTGLPRLKALQAYEVSPENPNLTSYDGVLYSKGFKMLYSCPPQKKSVVMPEGTTAIWGEAFESCHDIKELTIPASVTDIRLPVNEFSDMTIKGYTGSAAEDYVKRANEKGRNIKFIALGDADIPATPTPANPSQRPSALPTISPSPTSAASITPSPTTDFPAIKEDSSLTITEGGNLTGIIQNKNTVQEIRKQFAEADLIMKDASGKQLTDSEFLGTGATVSVMDGDTVKASCQVVLVGDVNGDGKVNGKDVSKLAQSLVGKVTLTDVQKEAAEVLEDGAVNGKDVSKLARSLVGKATISSQEK